MFHASPRFEVLIDAPELNCDRTGASAQRSAPMEHSNMVQGNFANGEYFIDCENVSLATGRAVFGASVTVYGTIITICVRSIYLSIIKTRLVANTRRGGKSKLWTISPISTTLEIIYLLPHVFAQRDIGFICTLLVCVLAALLSAFTTAIANHTVVINTAVRSSLVPGRLAISTAYKGQFLIANVTSRLRALDFANAPLEELFDFTPDDSSRWLYVPDQWNNSWHGQCAYHLYPAVDLTIYPTDFPIMANLIPGLVNWLPHWVTDKQTTESSDWARVYDAGAGFDNTTGAFRDSLHLFTFHNPLDDPTGQIGPSINISLANVLAHHIGRDADGSYVQTAFKSDVHVAECSFSNANPTETYRAAGNARSVLVAQTITDVFRFRVFDTSTNNQQVVQPTAKQMVRYWQAYMSVKDTLFEYPVQRNLSVARPIVQIRLSVLLIILVSFALTVTTALVFRAREPRDDHGGSIRIPGSTLDWVIEAARQFCHRSSRPATASTNFIAEHNDLQLGVSLTPDGRLAAHIDSSNRLDKYVSPVEHDQRHIMENLITSHRLLCRNCDVAYWSRNENEEIRLSPVEYDQQLASHRLLCGHCDVARWSVEHRIMNIEDDLAITTHVF